MALDAEPRLADGARAPDGFVIVEIPRRRGEQTRIASGGRRDLDPMAAPARGVKSVKPD